MEKIRSEGGIFQVNIEHHMSKSCLFEGYIPNDACHVWNGRGCGANGASDVVGLGEQQCDVVAVEPHGAL